MIPNAGIRKIQLWSDARGNEFAVRLSNESHYRAASNPAAKYAKLVDEAEYFSDLEYDWEFLLGHWVGVKDGSIKLLDNDGKKPVPAPFDMADALSSIQKPNGRRARREKPKPPLKCRFCMLSYNTEKERRDHELIWHPDKKKDSGQPNIK